MCVIMRVCVRARTCVLPLVRSKGVNQRISNGTTPQHKRNIVYVVPTKHNTSLQLQIKNNNIRGRGMAVTFRYIAQQF